MSRIEETTEAGVVQGVLEIPGAPASRIGDAATLRGSVVELLDRLRSQVTLGTVLRGVARVVVYPWLIWSAVAILPRMLRRRFFPEPGAGRSIVVGLHTLLYCCVGLPATVFVTGELLITGNEWLIGEQADYRIQSDYRAGLVGATVTIPGPAAFTPAPVEPAPTEEYRRYLVELYSPVIVHKLSHHPEWDIPLAVDFDGNRDPRDNVVNEPKHRPHVASVYGELTAETEDSYYLIYSLYHTKDYDHPLREALSNWTYHDNDNEGFMIRVDKETMEVEQLEAWYHNRFLVYANTRQSNGSEPIHGTIHVEDGTHPIIYAQPQGHGVRAFQAVDADALEENVKILRYRGDRPTVRIRADRELQVDGTYELVSFDWWYEQALGPFGYQGRGDGLFEESILLGHWPDGEEIRIGRYIAGLDYAIIGWSRPKPPWSWDDGWDEVPIWAWHYLPSYTIESHLGLPLSHEYLYNRPMEKTFGIATDSILPHLHLEVARRIEDKWKPLENRGTGDLKRKTYWFGFKILAKRYINYLFHALG